STDSKHIILYLHGGSYTSGTARQYRNMHLRLAQATGVQVLGFSYRLAPQAPYPTQLYDAYCAYQYVRDLGFSDDHIIFAGDSAGGNLALALWQLLRAPIRALVLLSPRVDVTSTRDSWKRNAQVDVLRPYTLDNSHSTIRQLLAPKGLSQQTYQLLSNPFIAPIHADLTQLPPILVQVGTAEVMLDDIVEFAAQAQMQSSSTVELQQYENMFHVFQAGLPGTRHFKEAWERIGAFI
ncbi:Alpha/Beta hydrolase protein, partial [Coemansia mojavensis]